MDNDEQELSEGLRALADADRSLSASARTRLAVMARWDAEHRVRATRTNWLQSRTDRTMLWMSAGAAAMVIAVVIPSMRRPAEPPAAPPAAEMADMASDRRSLTDEYPEADVFWPLGPLSPREHMGSSLQLMRVQLRGATLSRLGMPVDVVWASEVVEADVLVGEDGVARAIRFGR